MTITTLTTSAPPLVVSAPIPEPDSFWPPTVLDVEPEPLWCLPHGHELACAVCELATSTLSRTEPS